MKCLIILLVVLTSQLSDAVIYRLNDTEYLRMPPVFHLDDYNSCLCQPNGTYCYVEMDLVSDTHSDLLQMIHEYSEHPSNHFNHTQLHYGICLTKTCKNFLQGKKVVDPRLTLEKCLNQSLWRDYQLKTRLSNTFFCKKSDDPMNISVGDICAAVFFVGLGLLNVIGSLYDFCLIKGGKGHRLLLSFSLKRNFKKLITHENKDPLQERLKGMYGIKTLSIILVIFTHSMLPLVLNPENPHRVEETFYNIVYQLFFNGTLTMQTFFVMTGCLVAYNIRVYSEKNELNWALIPKGIMVRWLRLTPAYAVVLLFTLTWIRFVASGPLWEVAVGVEVAHCRHDWWLNIIYLINYIDNSQCMVQTWFLAANMQLYILSLFVCILANTPKSRSFVLSGLFVIGIIIPTIHTYVQDLDAVVIMSPETTRNFFVTDHTFNNLYKRGHTNIPGIVLGLVLGHLIYNGLRDEKKMAKYKKCGFLYYLTVPMIVVLLLSGMVFYLDRPRPSIYVRTVVGAFMKPLFAVVMTIFFIGMVFKFENLYRTMLEWRGWRTPARVSYSAYLIHVSIIRIYAGMSTTLSQIGFAHSVKEACGIIFLSFLIAYPFWLFVEAPLNQAIIIILGLLKKKNQGDENQKMDSVDKRIKQETVLNTESKKHST